MNYIILCDTTYQILSAISFRLDQTNNDDRVDLLVDTLRTRNVDLNKLANKIKKANIFTNVYCIGNCQIKYKRIAAIVKIFEWVLPSIVYKYMTNGLDITCNYDKVVVSGPFSTQRCLIAAYPNSEIIFIEDGLGSYIGRNGIRELTWRGKIAQKLFKYSPAHIYPKKVYLYAPDFYSGEYQDILEKMNFPKKYIEILDDIYSIDYVRINELYSNSKYVYFSQLVNPNDSELQIEKELVDVIKKNCKDDFIVRPHPRGSASIYDGLRIDDTYSQWELCCTEINEKSVLIGNFSTALFIPKLIYNVEPTVIFTYRLYGNSFVEDAVERLRNLYLDRKKIICLSSIDELNEILKRNK